MDYISIYMNVLFFTGIISFFTVIIWLPLALKKAANNALMKSKSSSSVKSVKDDCKMLKDSCIKMKQELMTHRNYEKLMNSSNPIDFSLLDDDIASIKNQSDFDRVLGGIIEIRDILNKLDTQTIKEIEENR